MTNERVTRRKKSISRLLREKKERIAVKLSLSKKKKL